MNEMNVPNIPRTLLSLGSVTLARNNIIRPLDKIFEGIPAGSSGFPRLSVGLGRFIET